VVKFFSFPVFESRNIRVPEASCSHSGTQKESLPEKEASFGDIKLSIHELLDQAIPEG
jgi:hypothetical protein